MTMSDARPLSVVGGTTDDRTCPECRQNDDDPRHVVIAGRFERSTATLSDGRAITLDVPVDTAFHMDCHAALGCDHCAEVLDANGGSVKGSTGGLNSPDGHDDIEPHEFVSGDNGVLRRVNDKDAAREIRESMHRNSED